jgi:hypothetical protein
MQTLSEDRKMKDLISRVGEDVSQLKSDIRLYSDGIRLTVGVVRAGSIF